MGHDDWDDDGKGSCGIRSDNLPTHTVVAKKPTPSDLRVEEVLGGCKNAIVEILIQHGLKGRRNITDGSHLFRAKVGDVLAGFGIFTPKSGKEVQCDWLYVKEEHRQHGIARKLWDVALAAFPGKSIHGKIVDESGAMEKIAKKSGAKDMGKGTWELDMDR